MSSAGGKDGLPLRWSALLREGRQLVLVDGRGGRWAPPDLLCDTDESAEHLARELRAWAKQVHSDEEYNRLCRAGD